MPVVHLPDAACALDAAGHDGFDERPDVLVLHGSLPFCETTAVWTELHGLILRTMESSEDGSLGRVILRMKVNIFIYLTVQLPVGHTLLPDHKWDSPAGGWPTGTPSLPLWWHTHTFIKQVY